MFLWILQPESSRQNDLCERNHATEDQCLEILLEENPWLPLATTLSWPLNAKNSLQMWCVFSLCILVSWKKKKKPSIATDARPALERLTMNTWFAQHIHNLHSALNANIQAEYSEKTCEVLRNKNRTLITVWKEVKKFIRSEIIQKNGKD